MAKKYMWTKRKEELLFTKIAKGKYIRRGVSCLFLPITKNVGAKLYKTKRIRDYAAKYQRLAADHKLGPQVGDAFTLEWNNIFLYNWASTKPIKVYGYLTQVAQQLKRTPSLKQQHELHAKLVETGLHCDDDKPMNLGRCGKNIVILDFGPESVGRY